MKRSTLLTVTGATGALGVLCLAVGQLPSCGRGGAVPGIFPTLDADASATSPEQREYDAATLRGAWTERKATVDELVAGRISLATAVSRFRAVDDGLPDRLRSRGEVFPEGKSREERYWRYVIRVTLSQLIEDPRRDLIAKRLEGELQDFLRSRLGPEADDGGRRLVERPRMQRPPMSVLGLPNPPRPARHAEGGGKNVQAPVAGYVED